MGLQPMCIWDWLTGALTQFSLPPQVLHRLHSLGINRTQNYDGQSQGLHCSTSRGNEVSVPTKTHKSKRRRSNSLIRLSVSQAHHMQARVFGQSLEMHKDA